MWESRVLRRAFERLELHEGKLSRAVLRGGGGGDVTSLPDTWVGNHPGLPGPMPPDPDAPPTSEGHAAGRPCGSRHGLPRLNWQDSRGNRRSVEHRPDGVTPAGIAPPPSTWHQGKFGDNQKRMCGT